MEEAGVLRLTCPSGRSVSACVLCNGVFIVVLCCPAISGQQQGERWETNEHDQ